MARTRNGAYRLGGIAGIDLYVHWTWLLVAYIQVSRLKDRYESPVWSVIEYVTLFGIVLMHEFGHALACRQVGGAAKEIMLWPLGGVAYVSPPPRPGAVLWSIAAGPLVNVALVPITGGAFVAGLFFDLDAVSPDALLFLKSIAAINLGLLIFNLLPIYPLDGGQILQSLLWFLIGRTYSLYVVSSVGIVIGLALVGVSAWSQEWWFLLLSAFIASRCWAGFQQARALSRLQRAERRALLACPGCNSSPPQGDFWTCGQCRGRFDIFERQGVCPHCGREFNSIQCPACHQQGMLALWQPPAAIAPGGAEG